LIKVSVLKTCELDMNEIAVELCANTGAQLVQKIGKTLVLYKPSREKKILLP
ncbi:MAG: YhbY family RNA-binding protein, partial [Erysipelotrichaceae bacterium]|nr:YhbY family RNA-binding protein [Erysipelotrichaceae bacterium]